MLLNSVFVAVIIGGLAYAVFSDLSPYSDTGLLSIYAGTALRQVEKLVCSVMDELRSLKEDARSFRLRREIRSLQQR